MSSEHKKTEEQLHYESVKSFLIWASSICAALILLAGSWAAYISFKDRESLQSQYQFEASKFKESLDQMRLEAKERQAELSERSDKEIAYSKDISEKQLSNIVMETRQTAITQSEKEISDIFKSDRIQSIIEKNAIGELKEKLPSTVAEYVKDLPKIMEAANFFRGQAPEGEEMLKSYFTSESAFERDMSKNIYKQIIKDTYQVYSDVTPDSLEFKLKYIQIPIVAPLHKVIKNQYPVIDNDIKNLEVLMDVTNDKVNRYMLHQRALAYNALSYISDNNFPLFDKEQIRKWYSGLKRNR